MNVVEIDNEHNVRSNIFVLKGTDIFRIFERFTHERLSACLLDIKRERIDKPIVLY